MLWVFTPAYHVSYECIFVVSTLRDESLVAAISAVLATMANPSDPIVVPAVATASTPSLVQERFIAFMVDLTHIMETLFNVSGGRCEWVGRRAIKLAYKAYDNSAVKAWAHSQIESYCELEGQDAALEMIERLIKPANSDDNANYRVNLEKLALHPMSLGQG
ncbi:hypothetical protein EDD15DRAFT_2479444 [Pisolithus albus]|nr:hypothetical protein EDD15DRAFT_2479435 [Pisolithus albus]KAI5984722.1 hypothetical protein EDD15DRAFT_2479444 [Pisolithus albus]